MHVDLQAASTVCLQHRAGDAERSLVHVEHEGVIMAQKQAAVRQLRFMG